MNPVTLKELEEMDPDYRKPKYYAQSVYMSKYWREYRAARKKGMPRSKARREASGIARIWYHRMKEFREE